MTAVIGGHTVPVDTDEVVTALRQARAALELGGDDARTGGGVGVPNDGERPAQQLQAAAVGFAELLNQLTELAGELRSAGNRSGAHAERYNNLEQHLRSAAHAAGQLTEAPLS